MKRAKSTLRWYEICKWSCSRGNDCPHATSRSLHPASEWAGGFLFPGSVWDELCPALWNNPAEPGRRGRLRLFLHEENLPWVHPVRPRLQAAPVSLSQAYALTGNLTMIFRFMINVQPLSHTGWTVFFILFYCVDCKSCRGEILEI